MRVLVTNDDGIHAPGIAVLERIARTLSDDVWVVAPADEQSGAGHSLSLVSPIRIQEFAPQRYAVRGTPTDAVMMALGHIIPPPKPTLVLSGVNRGVNLAEDVTYSGTVSAAIEATLAGVPAIALSQETAERAVGEEAFATAQTEAPALIQALLAQGWPKGVLININFPINPARGIRVTEQGLRDHRRLEVVERTDVRGFRYFWFGLGRDFLETGLASDLRAVSDGYVSVTPLQLNLTHRGQMATLGTLLNRG